MMNEYTTTSAFGQTSNVNLKDFIRIMQEKNDKSRNPNGGDKIVVRLDNFKPGLIEIHRQILPDTKPVIMGTIRMKEDHNRLSLDSDFRGVVTGKPKDPSKKYQIEYIGFSEVEIVELKRNEKEVNRK